MNRQKDSRLNRDLLHHHSERFHPSNQLPTHLNLFYQLEWHRGQLVSEELALSVKPF